MDNFPGDHHLQLAPVAWGTPLLACRAPLLLRGLCGALSGTRFPAFGFLRLLVLGAARRLAFARLPVGNAPTLPRCLSAGWARAVTGILIHAISGFLQIAAQMHADCQQLLVTQRLQMSVIQFPEIFVAD